MLGVLVFDTLPGLFIGIAVSVVLLLYRASRPHIALLARGTEPVVWVDLARHPGRDTDPRRAVRHAELLTGSDDGLAGKLHAVSEKVATAQGARWSDLVGPSGEAAREVVDKEVAKFAKAIRLAVEAMHDEAKVGTQFDGDFAFRAAHTMGYPVELAAEEAARIGCRSTTRGRSGTRCFGRSSAFARAAEAWRAEELHLLSSANRCSTTGLTALGDEWLWR